MGIGLSDGAWFLRSETDTRWNCSGDCRCGGFQMPSEAIQKIKELKELYGEEPPEDLKWSYHKY